MHTSFGTARLDSCAHAVHGPWCAGERLGCPRPHSPSTCPASAACAQTPAIETSGEQRRMLKRIKKHSLTGMLTVLMSRPAHCPRPPLARRNDPSSPAGPAIPPANALKKFRQVAILKRAGTDRTRRQTRGVPHASHCPIARLLDFPMQGGRPSGDAPLARTIAASRRHPVRPLFRMTRA